MDSSEISYLNDIQSYLRKNDRKVNCLTREHFIFVRVSYLIRLFRNKVQLDQIDYA